jgi:hypothetical protein
MPWLGPYPDAPDTHKLWADEGSTLAAALRASGFKVVQAAPGSGEQDSPVLLTDLLTQEETEEDDDAP